MDDVAPPPAPGTALTVVKLDLRGNESARYAAVSLPAPPGWVVVRAGWQQPRVEADRLSFEPGDTLIEYFSLREPVNAFAVFDASDQLKGWYGNVSLPARLQDNRLIWQDLYLDIIVYPDGTTVTLDEDELEAANLRDQNPARYALIEEGLALLRRKAASRAYPFSEHEP